jgi:CheY-like chemotaxis protein
MALVVALIPDLLFGSRVSETLTRAGHEVQLVADQASLIERLSGAAAVVVDLDADGVLSGELVERLGADRPPILGFYPHVDADKRTQALAGGFDVVVPRSRMAREGEQLLSDLLSRD